MARPLYFAIVWSCMGMLAPAYAHANTALADTLVPPSSRSESADSVSAVRAGAMSFSEMKSPGRAFRYSLFGTAIPVVIGIGVGTTDIAQAPRSARVHNEKVAGTRVGVAPFAGSVAGAPGVGMRVTF